MLIVESIKTHDHDYDYNHDPKICMCIFCFHLSNLFYNNFLGFPLIFFSSISVPNWTKWSTNLLSITFYNSLVLIFELKTLIHISQKKDISKISSRTINQSKFIDRRKILVQLSSEKIFVKINYIKLFNIKINL